MSSKSQRAPLSFTTSEHGGEVEYQTWLSRCCETRFVHPLEIVIKKAYQLGSTDVHGDSSDEEADKDDLPDDEEQQSLVAAKGRGASASRGSSKQRQQQLQYERRMMSQAHHEDRESSVLQELPHHVEDGIEDKRRETRDKSNAVWEKRFATWMHKVFQTDHPNDDLTWLTSGGASDDETEADEAVRPKGRSAAEAPAIDDGTASYASSSKLPAKKPSSSSSPSKVLLKKPSSSSSSSKLSPPSNRKEQPKRTSALMGALGKKLDSTLGLHAAQQNGKEGGIYVNSPEDLDDLGKALGIDITEVDDASDENGGSDGDDGKDDGKDDAAESSRRASKLSKALGLVDEEMERTALELFAECDRDGDGNISKEELRSVVHKNPDVARRLGVPCNDDQKFGQFWEYHVHGYRKADGAAVSGLSRKDFFQIVRKDRLSRAAAQQLFTAVDSDASGYIEMEEMRKAAAEHPELFRALIVDDTHDDHLHANDEQIDSFLSWWSDVDAAGDNRLSLEEFTEAFKARQLTAYHWNPPADLQVSLESTRPAADAAARWEADNGFAGFDVAFVSPWPLSPQQASLLEGLLRKLKGGGLDTFAYRASSHANAHHDAAVVVLVRASLRRLKEHASETGHRLPLSQEGLLRLASSPTPPPASSPAVSTQPGGEKKQQQQQQQQQQQIGQLRLQDDFRRVRLHPFEFLHCAYRGGDFWNTRGVFHAPGGLSHPFSSRQRIAIVLDICTYPAKYGGCAVVLTALGAQFCEYFPLHKVSMLRQIDRQFHPSFFLRMEKFLRQQDEATGRAATGSSAFVELVRFVARWGWAFIVFEVSQLWHVPVRMLRDYFGEKTALYFAFLGHYVRWQIGLALVGVVASVEMMASSTGEARLAPWFAIFLSVWGQQHARSWKYYEFSFACRYGVPPKVGLENTSDRPSFHGVITHSVIDGSEIRYYPWERRLARYVVSSCVVSFLALLGGLAVAGILSLRLYLVHKGGRSQQWAEALTSGLLGIYISMSNQAFRGTAQSLTGWENHRTDAEFEDALVFKLFVVQFLNSYATLYYVAFFKDPLEGCLNSHCVTDLSYRLIGLLVSRMLYVGFYKLALPRLTVVLRRSRALMRARHIDYEGDDVAHRQAHLNRYDAIMETTIAYDEMIIDLGYLTLFSAATPIVPLLMLPLTLLRKQCDGAQLLFDFRRPVPVTYSTIGMWNYILTVMSRLSILTNALIIIVTMHGIDNEHYRSKNLRAAAVVGFVVVLVLFAMPAPRENFAIRIQRLREAYVVERLQRMAAEHDDASRQPETQGGLAGGVRGGKGKSKETKSEEVLMLKRSQRRRSTLGAAYHHYAV